MKATGNPLRKTGDTARLPWLAPALFALLSIAITGAQAASVEESPPNDPKRIVEKLIERDLKGLPRYDSNDSFTYSTWFESYPDWLRKTEKNEWGNTVTLETPPAFGQCAQIALVKNIRVQKMEHGWDPNSPVTQPRFFQREVIVTVEAEVVALVLPRAENIPPENRCSWYGLQVINTETGKIEHYFDNVDNDKVLLKMMREFGAPESTSNIVIVPPHRRKWSYGIDLLLPVSGKGNRRHYDRAAKGYVDAVEPRWLIQEPYPPQAVHIQSYLQREEAFLRFQMMQLRQRCIDRIAESTGTAPRKADFNHAACQGDNDIQQQLASRERIKSETQLLRSIK